MWSTSFAKACRSATVATASFATASTSSVGASATRKMRENSWHGLAVNLLIPTTGQGGLESPDGLDRYNSPRPGRANCSWLVDHEKRLQALSCAPTPCLPPQVRLAACCGFGSLGVERAIMFNHAQYERVTNFGGLIMRKNLVRTQMQKLA